MPINVKEMTAVAVAWLIANPTVITSGAAAIIAATSLYIAVLALRRSVLVQRLSLFLEFRSRFISDSMIADMAEVAQLLLDNNQNLARDIYSPSLERFLNHLEWIGCFVKKKLISREHIWSTFGSEVLNFCPVLFDYIGNVRIDRKAPDLWFHVDLLYKRLWRYAKWRRLLGNRELRSSRRMKSYLPKNRIDKCDIKRYLKIQTKNKQ